MITVITYKFYANKKKMADSPNAYSENTSKKYVLRNYKETPENIFVCDPLGFSF